MLGPLADHSHDLSDHLGDDHDLALSARPFSGAGQPSPTQPTSATCSSRSISAAASSIRRDLPCRAIYADKPKRFTKRLEKRWEAWRDRKPSRIGCHSPRGHPVSFAPEMERRRSMKVLVAGRRGTIGKQLGADAGRGRARGDGHDAHCRPDGPDPLARGTAGGRGPPFTSVLLFFFRDRLKSQLAPFWSSPAGLAMRPPRIYWHWLYRHSGGVLAVRPRSAAVMRLRDRRGVGNRLRRISTRAIMPILPLLLGIEWIVAVPAGIERDPRRVACRGVAGAIVVTEVIVIVVRPRKELATEHGRVDRDRRRVGEALWRQ